MKIRSPRSGFRIEREGQGWTSTEIEKWPPTTSHPPLFFTANFVWIAISGLCARAILKGPRISPRLVSKVTGSKVDRHFWRVRARKTGFFSPNSGENNHWYPPRAHVDRHAEIYPVKPGKTQSILIPRYKTLGETKNNEEREKEGKKIVFTYCNI